MMSGVSEDDFRSMMNAGGKQPVARVFRHLSQCSQSRRGAQI